RIILTIGAADFLTTGWCNGHPLGSHEGGYTPFEFDITETLESGEDGQFRGTIVLRVEDAMDNHDQPVGKQWGWYSSASGIWQTVFIEPRPKNFIERFEVTTDIDNSEAQFNIFVSGGDDLTLKIESPLGDHIEKDVPIRNGIGHATVNLGVSILWDPNAPELYQFELQLRDGAQVDRVQSY